MSYRTTKRADQDIIDIYVHGATAFGVDQAERYHEGMVSVFELLAENPHLAACRTCVSGVAGPA
ncbi:type II toxin-antitoxin system RelE/ParE family toxin [Defluviicoccus vanus]|uniref:Type II toxin-antitoxin system RelE/ParE family toxin n=1 Tax=Defluviicoccus vanus TaxID=111831 RepID=A0A7H1MY29_9PROT|nr:type II toxin-antitoxin system RelE/ParE family toxin [Defluviicoccus vanus]QNT68365.1 type II toxin-antitoxin system RelE/ParE family toxin [Defluviicoccus vanus]